MLSLLCVVAAGLSVDVIAVSGARDPAQVKEAVAALPFGPCVQQGRGQDGGRGFDVVVDVAIAGAGSSVGAEELLLSPGALEQVSLACVRAAVETLALPDRGREPPTHALVRLVDVRAGEGAAGAAPPLPLRQIDKAVGHTHADTSRCVTHLRRRHPQLRGSVVARLTLDGDGDVVSSDFSGDQRDLVGCVQDNLRGFHVEEFSGGPKILVVHYAFDGFAPASFEQPERHRTLASFIGCL